MNRLLVAFYAADGMPAEKLACEIVELAQPRIRETLASDGVKGDDLDDLCQSAQLALLQALRASHTSEGKRIDNAIAFARAVARNLVIDAHRSRRSRPQLTSIEELAEQSDGDTDKVLPPDSADVEETVVTQEWFRGQVWPLICELRPQHRAALLLGLGQDELLLLAGKISAVATILDIPLAEFVSFWRDLPLQDRRIAQVVGVTGEGKTSAEGRISNLRKCALERIGRHLNKSM